MTGRRLFLLLVLVCSLSVQASQPSYPLIVQIPLTIDITNIVTALGGKVIDAIPGAGAYLLRVQSLPPSWMLSLSRIQWTEHAADSIGRCLAVFDGPSRCHCGHQL